MSTSTRPSAAQLRRKAEQQLAEREAHRGPIAPKDAAHLVHELEVHQIELEMQNEELRQARHEIELCLQRYTELFDFAPIGYVVLDASGTVVEANLEAARMLGVARGRLAGRPFAPFVLEKYRPGLAALLARALADQGAGSASEPRDKVLCGEGGQELNVRFVASALAGAEPRVMLAMIDITRLVRAEAAVRQESHRKDEFLAALSHELRNPLAPLRTNLELLERLEPGGEGARRAIAAIDRQMEHLTHIVDDLLDVTRIAHGKVRLQRARAELGALVRRAVDDHRTEFDARGIALEARLDPGPFWVDADATRLVQVLGNLLGNACKFTPRGGRVEVGLRGERGWAVLSVRDNGVGIAPEVREQLFQPFIQGPQTLDRSRGGLGLGLATVKGLVELHGGTVDVQSEGPGRGAEFIVRLPLTRAPEKAEAVPAPTTAPPRRRVLVIEDNEDAADAIRDVLKLDGHDARAAYDGATGLALAREFHPDVVLCDIGLPEMDGYEVARALRADDALRGIYLVALSGYARPEDLQHCAEAGFDSHVAKPPSIQSIERVVDEQPRWRASDGAVAGE